MPACARDRPTPSVAPSASSKSSSPACAGPGRRGQIVMRFDSGYWSNETIKVLARLGVSYTMAVRTGTKAIDSAIAEIAESDWVAIEYPAGGRGRGGRDHLQGTPPHRAPHPPRRSPGDPVAQLATLRLLERPRRHARWNSTPSTVATPSSSSCIDDWKEGAGMEHCPSGDFSANAAWMCCAVLAHNLIRWSAKLGGLVEEDTLVVARTLRTRYFSVPARLVNRSGTPTLRGPTHWPWAARSPEHSTTCAPSPSPPPDATPGGPAWPQTITHTLTIEMSYKNLWFLAPLGPNSAPSRRSGQCTDIAIRFNAAQPESGGASRLSHGGTPH